MMGFLSSAVGAGKRPRGVSVGEEIPEDTEPDDTSILYVSLFSFIPLRSSSIHPSLCPFLLLLLSLPPTRSRFDYARGGHSD